MKKINVPCLIILLILILGGAACIFSPTIAAWYIAESRDGFTLGLLPDQWWNAGAGWAIVIVAMGAIVLMKVIDAGRHEVL